MPKTTFYFWHFLQIAPIGMHLTAQHLLRFVFVTMALALLASRASAQQDTQQSMYWAVPTLYNPATAGSDSALHISAFDRMQWTNVHDGPQTFFVSADLPVMLGRKRTGVGLSAYNDQAGLFTTTLINLQLSGSLKLLGGRLALGVQPTFVNEAFRGGDVFIPTGEAWDPSDDAIPTGDVSGMGFDLGAGLFYERSGWYGGLSVQHLIGPEVELSDYALFDLTPTYYFHAGGNIPLKRTLFTLQPSLLLKTTFQFVQCDLTLRATYDHRFWGGVTYRPGDSVVLMVGADMSNVRFGYAYDVPISMMSWAGGGSHEILATYTMHIDLDKHNRRGTKSIRIL